MNTEVLIALIIARVDALSRRHTPGEPLPSSLRCDDGIGIAELLARVDPPVALWMLAEIQNEASFMVAYEALLTHVGNLLIEERRRRDARATRQ